MRDPTVLHPEPSTLSGTAVKIRAEASHPQVPNFGGSEFKVEDWWDRVGGGSWTDAVGNPACIAYAIRIGVNKVLFDNEVLYGKIGRFGHLVHISEIEEHN